MSFTRSKGRGGPRIASVPSLLLVAVCFLKKYNKLEGMGSPTPPSWLGYIVGSTGLGGDLRHLGLSRREEQRICNPFIEIAYNVVFKKWIVKQWSDVFMGAVFKAV